MKLGSGWRFDLGCIPQPGAPAARQQAAFAGQAISLVVFTTADGVPDLLAGDTTRFWHTRRRR